MVLHRFLRRHWMLIHGLGKKTASPRVVCVFALSPYAKMMDDIEEGERQKQSSSLDLVRTLFVAVFKTVGRADDGPCASTQTRRSVGNECVTIATVPPYSIMLMKKLPRRQYVAMLRLMTCASFSHYDHA